MEVCEKYPERSVQNLLVYVNTPVLIGLFDEKRVQFLIACLRAVPDANRNDALTRFIQHFEHSTRCCVDIISGNGS